MNGFQVSDHFADELTVSAHLLEYLNKEWCIDSLSGWLAQLNEGLPPLDDAVAESLIVGDDRWTLAQLLALPYLRALV